MTHAGLGAQKGPGRAAGPILALSTEAMPQKGHKRARLLPCDKGHIDKGKLGIEGPLPSPFWLVAWSIYLFFKAMPQKASKTSVGEAFEDL